MALAEYPLKYVVSVGMTGVSRDPPMHHSHHTCANEYTGIPFRQSKIDVPDDVYRRRNRR